MLSETLGRNLSCFFLAFGDGRQSLDFSCITLGSSPCHRLALSLWVSLLL